MTEWTKEADNKILVLNLLKGFILGASLALLFTGILFLFTSKAEAKEYTAPGGIVCETEGVVIKLDTLKPELISPALDYAVLRCANLGACVTKVKHLSGMNLEIECGPAVKKSKIPTEKNEEESKTIYETGI